MSGKPPLVDRTRRALGALTVATLAACSPMQLGSRTLDFSGMGTPQSFPAEPVSVAAGPSESFGRGPVKVALLLPLSGDLAPVGQSLANASKLAISFIESNPNIGENIAITLRDTGGSVAGATSAANAAIGEGAKLILGPLRADEVTAAGAVARAGGVPLIGFSNTVSAAAPGVYLLSVLPDAEMKRSIRYLQSQGRRGLAGAFPATPYGESQAAAFRQQAQAAGFAPQAVYTFASPAEAQQIAAQAMPLIQQGLIDSFFLPDRASAPLFAQALSQAGAGQLQIVGSADWQGDRAILASPALGNAVYPAVDPAGLQAISAEYQTRFGTAPHALATIAYTATILANVNTLSLATPPYNTALLTTSSGFNGRDGVFRFLPNGRAEYGLVLLQVRNGAAAMIEGVKL